MSHPSTHDANNASAQPDLDTARRNLESAAQTLLLCCQQNHPAPPDIAPPDTAESNGETRSYYFPPQAVRRERTLLGEHRAADLAALLTQAHYRIMGLARLMKSVQPNAKLKGQAISSLGTMLEQAANPMLRMCAIYDQVRRVPADSK